MPEESRSNATTYVLIAIAVVVAIVLGALLFTQCSSDSAEPEDETTQAEAPAEDATEEEVAPTEPEEEPVFTPTYQPNGEEVAVIETDKGTIKVELYADDAPNHVASFVELAQSGFYDGTTFHRVEPGFVVQGGDPYSKTGEGPPGTGGPGYTIDAEFNSRQHLEGTLAMARAMDPNSAGSQFYICLAPQPSLDGQYTVFGQVTEGMDVVRQIAINDVMNSLTIENATE
jgi:peptidyl-prolyl cis-trans isomerase B (cyclophilin B)